MVEIRFVKEQDLQNDMMHVFSWRDKAHRDEYFDNKAGTVRYAKIQATPNLNAINIEMDFDRASDFDYLYFEDDNERRYYYFIQNKLFKTQKVTTLILELDYWTTYQFDIDLNKAFVERCHQDRWKNIDTSSVQKYIPNKFVDLEGINPGEYKLSNITDVCDLSDTVIYTSSVPLGVIGSNNTQAGTETSDMWTDGRVSSKGFRFIKGWEAYAPRAYKDSGGYYTIGYGVTKHGNPTYYAEHIKKAPCSEAYCAQESYDIIRKQYGLKIVEAVKALGCTNQHQFDALCSLAYNCGPGVVTGSNSLTNAIKKNPLAEVSIRSVWEKFYITSGGVTLTGLKNRRKQECDLFFGKKVEMRPIGIANTAGKITGTVTENNGNGWLPGDLVNENTNTNTTPSGPQQQAPVITVNQYKYFDNYFGKNWLCPVRNAKVTSLYGNRKHPVTGVYRMHYGIDFGATHGTDTVASKDGTVHRVGWENPNDHSQGYGLRVIIKHNISGSDYYSYYPHLSKTSVKVGDKVKQGQKVGEIGSTGSSTGSHCHWEIRNGANGRTNPAPTLKVGDKV